MTVENFLSHFDLFASTPHAVEKMADLVLGLAFTGGLSDTRADEDGLPAGWRTMTFGELCESIQPGFACSKSHQTADGYVHLRTHNISTLGVLNFDLMIRIDPTKVDSAKDNIRRGDILFNNTNSQELVGKERTG